MIVLSIGLGMLAALHLAGRWQERRASAYQAHLAAPDVIDGAHEYPCAATPSVTVRVAYTRSVWRRLREADALRGPARSTVVQIAGAVGLQWMDGAMALGNTISLSADLATDNGFILRPLRLLGGDDRLRPSTGDPTFDRLVHVDGPLDAIAACTQPEHREALMRLSLCGGEVRDGRVRVVRSTWAMTPEDAQQAARAVYRVVQALDLAQPGIEAVARTAKEDIDDRARARALWWLHTEHPDHALTTERLAAARRTNRLEGADIRAWALALQDAPLDGALTATIALAREGTADHLPVLRMAAERDPLLKTAVQATVAEILTRHPRKTGGELSVLPADDRGHLALAEASRAGGLQITETKSDP